VEPREEGGFFGIIPPSYNVYLNTLFNRHWRFEFDRLDPAREFIQGLANAMGGVTVVQKRMVEGWGIIF
jgi:hypothetical protein